MAWITKMNKSKRQFLAAVFKFSLVAFGGPSAHIAMLLKEFVDKKKICHSKRIIRV
jgi:chromate transport protein ChrA